MEKLRLLVTTKCPNKMSYVLQQLMGFFKITSC